VVKILKVEDPRRCIGCMLCSQACARLYGDFSVFRAAIHVHTTGGMPEEFIITSCRACLNPSCREACPCDALKAREGGGVVFLKESCSACGACLQGCPIGAIRADEDNHPIICRHCGYCAKYCPHNCIILKEIQSDQPQD
jgi:carbon-monoxide dehydrogenase iron sulfur subunit